MTQSHQFETPLTPEFREVVLHLLEGAGRTCWKSEGKAKEGSAPSFVQGILTKNHMSVIEHAGVTVRFVTDRGITHELVRHRLASFSQESTRYVASATRSKLRVETDAEVVSAYEAGQSMKRIAGASGKTEWEVYKIITRSGIPKRGHNNFGAVQADYFNTIDTTEKAYLLGLIQADGSLRAKGSPTLNITQHGDYAWYIERMLKDFVCSSVSKSKDRMCVQLHVTSQGIWDALVSKGVIPNKSSDAGEAEAELLWGSVPETLRWDFLRGLLDGDGCVRFFKQTNPGETSSALLNWLGSEQLLRRVHEFLYAESPTFETKVRRHGTSACYGLNIKHPATVLHFCRKMYKNFKFPYGHPKKACRILEQIGQDYPIADWGDPEFRVIRPTKFDAPVDPGWWSWFESMARDEDAYAEALWMGWAPQDARGVLPNALKTEIVMTANLREWRHIFSLRCAPAAHPQIRALMTPVLHAMAGWMPEVFQDLADQFCGDAK
jgi:thymidylate synthase ThyX